MPYRDPIKAKEYNRKWAKNYYKKHKNEEHFKEKRKEWGKNTRKRLNTDVQRKEKYDKRRREWCKSSKGLESSRKWRENNKEKLALYMKEWQKNHPQQCRDAVKRCHQKRNPQIKIEVFTHYSNGTPKCACCGETEIRFLTIDHINGGGNKQRKQLGLSGSGIYKWLIRNGFPEGYQVLCYSCNLGRAHNKGVCPHKDLSGEHGVSTTMFI
jgi:hypothetical protein